MGEACIRGNVSHGDGVYRSTDGGKSWSHLGLENTRNIGKVRVHPEDPDTAYVAALGHAHGPNPERGIFRTRDGGKSWKRVLSRGPKADRLYCTAAPVKRTSPTIAWSRDRFKIGPIALSIGIRPSLCGRSDLIRH